MRNYLYPAAVAILAAAAACAPANGPDSGAIPSAVLAGIRAEAEINGASDAQLAILDAVADSGEVTFEQLKAANEAELACLDDNGFTYTAPTSVELAPGSGFFTLDFVIFEPAGLSENEALAVMDTCSNTHSAWVTSAYMSMPIAREALFAEWKDPAVIECLRERGYDVDDDATGAEINALVTEDVLSHLDADPDFRGCPASRS